MSTFANSQTAPRQDALIGVSPKTVFQDATARQDRIDGIWRILRMLIRTLMSIGVATIAAYWLARQHWSLEDERYVLVWTVVAVGSLVGTFLVLRWIGSLFATTQAGEQASNWWHSLWYWQQTRTALRETFSKDRNIAARAVNVSVRRLRSKGSDAFALLYYAIPALIRSTTTVAELAAVRQLEALDSAVRANRRLCSRATLIVGVPTATAVASNPAEREQYFGLATRLAARGIDPSATLHYLIPTTIPAAQQLLGRATVLHKLETIIMAFGKHGVAAVEELAQGISSITSGSTVPETLQQYLDLVIALNDNGMNPTATLRGHPAIITAAASDDELLAYLAFAKRLAQKHSDPAILLKDGVPSVAAIAQTSDERETLLNALEKLATGLVKTKSFLWSARDLPHAARGCRTAQELTAYLESPPGSPSTASIRVNSFGTRYPHSRRLAL